MLFLDWDKCRSLCPVEKAVPPVNPGAQLTKFEQDEKWEREHWEDETISYGCENFTLVSANDTFFWPCKRFTQFQ